MRMITGVGTEDMEREMSRNGIHILAALMFLQKNDEDLACSISK